MVKPTTHSAYCFVSGQSDPSKTPTSSKFILSIRQQPQRAKVCGVKERDRRPIDPPPIIQIKLAEPSTDKNKDYLQSPYLFMCCNLVHANEPDGEIVAPAHRALAGTVVSSLNRLKDVDNSDGGFFVFGDMSARIEGRFRLRFTLFELVEGQVVHVMSIASNPVTVHSSKTFPGMCESTFLSRSFSDQGVRIRIRKDHHVKPKRPVNETSDADEEEESHTSAAMHSPPSSCHDGDPSDHDSQPAKRTKSSASSSSAAAAGTGSAPIAIATRPRHHRSKSRYSSEEASERTPPSSPGPYVAFGSAPSWGRHHPYRLDISPRRYEDPRYSTSLRFRDPYYEHERPSAFYEGLHIESNSRRFDHPGFARTALVHHPREIRDGRPEHGYPVEYAAQRERSRSFGHPRYISASSLGYFHHPFEGHGAYWVEGHPVYFHGPEPPPPHAIALAHPPSGAFTLPQGSPLSHVTPSSKSSKSRATHSTRQGFPAALLNNEEMEDVTSINQHDVLHSRTPSMSSQHSENNLSPPHPFSPSESHVLSMNRGAVFHPEILHMRDARLHTPTSPHVQGRHGDGVTSRSSLSSAGGDERIHLPPIHTLSTHSPSTKMEVSNKERKEHKKHKKNKKNREHKEHKDKKRKHEDDIELNAGSFKKALVTPTTETTAVSSTSSHPVSVGPGGPGAASTLEELGLYAAGHSSADNDSSSDEDEDTARSKALQKARSVNDATMAAVADLLTATTGSASGAGTGGVNADVIKMQQQLQQQIPFTASTTTTTASSAEQLTREEILESIAGIPAMQILLQQDGLGTSTAVVQQPHQDANAILMSLSNDPSILATVNNPEHQPTLGQIMQREAAAQQAANEAAAAASGLPVLDGKSTSSKKKKAAAAGPKKNTRQGVPATAAANNRTLEEQMEYDMSGASDSLLHTKWMMATELKERGIAYRTGTFSAEEDIIIRQSINEYISRHNMAENSIHEWFEKSSGRGSGKLERNELKPLWVEIAGRLKTRPLLNIYLHVRRMYHPQNNIGAWTKEDDVKLVELHAKHKGQWTTIGQALGRMADSCRDRYRNHLKDQDTMNSGTWAPEEDRKLLDIMQDLANKQGKPNLAEATHMWTAISELMGGTRSRHQCRHRYTQSLQPKMEMADWKPPTLAETMAASNVMQLQKSISEKSQQSQQQHQAEAEGSSSSAARPAAASTEFSVPDEDIRVLAAALQNVIPNGSDGSLLWTQAIGGSGSTQAGGTSSMSSADQADHAALTAAIAAATSLPVPSSAALLSPALLTAPAASTAKAADTASTSTVTTAPTTTTGTTEATAAAVINPLPPTPDHLQRRTGARQRALDVLRLIEKSGYKEYSEIKWKTMAKKLRAKIQEANGEMLGKVIEARERLSAKKDKAVSEGDRYNGSVLTGVVAAMDAALTAAHAESVTTVQFSASSTVLQQGFVVTRCKVEGYKTMPFKELLGKMIEIEEEEVRMYRETNKTVGNAKYAEAALVRGPSANRETFVSIARFRQMRTYFVAKQAAIKGLSQHFGENSRRTLSSIQSRAEELLRDELNADTMMPILSRILHQMQLDAAASGHMLSSSSAADPNVRTNEFVVPGEEDSDYEQEVAAAAAAAVAAGTTADDSKDLSGEDDDE